eukprot:jgi/Psemu1/21751/gm1.21751_g
MTSMTTFVVFLVVATLPFFQSGVWAAPAIDTTIIAQVEQEVLVATISDCDPSILLNISVMADHWAFWETKWYLKDSSGNDILMRAPQNLDSTLYVCFVFGITDDAGDGLCIPSYDAVTQAKVATGCGFYNVTLGDTLVLEGGGFFFHEEELEICTGSATPAPSDSPSVSPSYRPTITSVTPTPTTFPTRHPTRPSYAPTFPSIVSSDCGVDEGGFQIILHTDKFGGETALSLVALESAQTLFNYSFNSFDSLKLHWIPSKSEVICLPKGCYEFVIADGYGDGICNPYFQEHLKGYYQLFLDESLLHSGCDFNTNEKTSFCVGANFSLAPTTSPSQYPTWAPTDAPTFSPNQLFSSECEVDEGAFQLYLQTDDFGSEIGWSLMSQGSGEILIQHGYDPSGNYSVIYGSSQNYWIPSKASFMCLPKGCYTFKIVDEFGDGICNFNLIRQGFYELYLDGFLIGAGCNYRQQEKKFFCVGSEHTSQPTESAAPSFATTTFFDTSFPTHFDSIVDTLWSSGAMTSNLENDDGLEDVNFEFTSASPSPEPTNTPTLTPSSVPSLAPTTFCVDRKGLAYKNKEDKNCGWVSGNASAKDEKQSKTTKRSKTTKKTKKTKNEDSDVDKNERDRIKTIRKRCKKSWQGQQLFHWCRKTCGDVGRGPCKA